jgi:hypothetical protein
MITGIPRRASRQWLCPLLLAAAALAGGALASPAEAPLEQTTAPPRCDRPEHHQLDFWVGDWQVWDTGTHQLIAFDRVEKQYEDCVLIEHLTFLTDTYRRPGVPVRLAGVAINRFDGERWLQMWADNQWGAIVLRGAPNASGNMEFVSVIPSRNRDVKLVYEPQADGGLRIVQYVAPAGSGRWVKYGDLSYHRNR